MWWHDCQALQYIETAHQALRKAICNLVSGAAGKHRHATGAEAGFDKRHTQVFVTVILKSQHNVVRQQRGVACHQPEGDSACDLVVLTS